MPSVHKPQGKVFLCAVFLLFSFLNESLKYAIKKAIKESLLFTVQNQLWNISLLGGYANTPSDSPEFFSTSISKCKEYKNVLYQ